MGQRKYKDLSIGESISLKQTASDEYVRGMAELTGDDNPIHLDEEYSKNSFFGQRIAHGLFCDGMISRMLGTELPGLGTIYLEKHIQFRAPVYINDEIEATLTITNLIGEKNLIDLAFVCEKNDGTVVAKGEVRVKLP